MVHLINGFMHIQNHSWHDIKMSQMTELYIAMMLKTLGLSLIGIFIPIYLYNLGYSLQSIALFFMFNYGFRIFWDYVTAWLVGWFGPKHIMILSHVFLIAMLGLLFAMENTYVPLSLVALFSALAYSFFFIAYHIEFSKIQTKRAGGTQVGRMVQLGKLASASGPLVGGILAYVFGFDVVIGVAMLIILSSAIPLLASKEPVRLRQNVTLKGFPYRRFFRTVASNSAGGPSQIVNLFFWPLFVALFVFEQDAYVNVGLITSLGLFASFFTAKFIGHRVDNKQAAGMFRIGLFGSAFIHLVRTIVRSSPLAYFVNIMSEPFNISYMIPYAKNFYAEASSIEGYRNVYIASVIVGANVSRFLIWSLFFVLSIYVSDLATFQLLFVAASFSIPLVLFNNFKDLKA